MPHLAAGVKLRSAVLELAAARPIGELTVTDVCRAAGVTRDSFYRFAANPDELLASALAERMEAVQPGEFARMPLSEVRARLYRSLDDLIDFVDRHAGLLRLASRPHLSAPLRALIVDQCSVGLGEYLVVNPSILPEVEGPALTAGDRSILVALTANGTVGAVEQWLSLGEEDIGQLRRMLLLGTAAWWLAGDADDDNGSP